MLLFNVYPWIQRKIKQLTQLNVHMHKKRNDNSTQRISCKSCEVLHFFSWCAAFFSARFGFCFCIIVVLWNFIRYKLLDMCAMLWRRHSMKWISCYIALFAIGTGSIRHKEGERAAWKETKTSAHTRTHTQSIYMYVKYVKIKKQICSNKRKVLFVLFVW